MRRVLSTILVAGCAWASYATDARVLTMGRTDAFFMDDISIYRNPANISVYPNMLIGSLGLYRADTTLDSTSQFAALARYNRDPQRPFFGGILSYSLNQSAEAGDQYPMLSIGLVINRHDPLLDYLMPGTEIYGSRAGRIYDVTGNLAGLGASLVGDSVATPIFAEPLGKIDVLLGYALPNGAMIGAGGYFAFQKVSNGKSGGSEEDPLLESRLMKGNLGVTWPIAKTMDLEVSAGGAAMTGIGRASPMVKSSRTVLDTIDDDSTRLVIADGDWSIRGDIRLFSALRTLNGDFVPHFGIERVNLADGNHAFTNVAFGVGLNLNIDRGFFWAGLEGLYEDASLRVYDPLASNEWSTKSTSGIGARISFGIERNVLWDWLIWRVGGSKKIMYQSEGTEEGQWVQNPEANAGDDDLVAFGLGLNIENRLKVDGVVAEDIFYTFSNLFSGNHHHLMTRITVTYSF